jgi:carbon monoxide dehydrogenase subunit G
MGIEIEKRFVVEAPADAVWELLIDPYRVARCLPGAAITEKLDERTYAGTMTVKVGPVTASYRGKLRFERLDAAAREAELSASGQETRGKGGADMRMRSRVDARSEAETEVTVVSDVNVVGVLAQFGRGMIQDVSDQLFQRFTAAMSRELEAPAAPPAETPPAAVTAPAAALGALQAATAGAPVATPPPDLPAPVPVSAAPAPPPVEPVLDVGALGAAAAGRAIGRTLRRPGFWIAAAVLALLLFWLLHR